MNSVDQRCELLNPTAIEVEDFHEAVGHPRYRCRLRRACRQRNAARSKWQRKFTASLGAWEIEFPRPAIITDIPMLRSLEVRSAVIADAGGLFRDAVAKSTTIAVAVFTLFGGLFYSLSSQTKGTERVDEAWYVLLFFVGLLLLSVHAVSAQTALCERRFRALSAAYKRRADELAIVQEPEVTIVSAKGRSSFTRWALRRQ